MLKKLGVLLIIAGSGMITILLLKLFINIHPKAASVTGAIMITVLIIAIINTIQRRPPFN